MRMDMKKKLKPEPTSQKPEGFSVRFAVFVALFLIIFFLPLLPAHAAKPVEVQADNGLSAWLIEDSSVPVISANIIFRRSGYAYEPPIKAGVTQLLARMLTKGAGNLDSRAFNARLDELAIELGYEADEDDFVVTLKTLSTNRQEAFHLLGLSLAKPAFNSKELTLAKANLLSDLKSQEQQPAFSAEKIWRKKFFGNHAYGWAHYPNDKSVNSVTRADLEKQRSNLFNLRDGIIISVVGDIKPDDLKQLLNNAFAGIKLSQASQVSALPEPVKPTPGMEITERDIPQSIVIFGLPWLPRQHPDYITSFVLNHIVGGGGFTSRLMRELREKNGLTYGISASSETLDGSAYLQGSFSTKNSDVKMALDKVSEQLTLLAEKGVTEDELKDAKSYITGSFPLVLDTNAKIAYFLGVMQKYDLGMDYLDKRNALIEAVTLEDVNKMAKQLIKPDALVLGIAGKPDKI